MYREYTNTENNFFDGRLMGLQGVILLKRMFSDAFSLMKVLFLTYKVIFTILFHIFPPLLRLNKSGKGELSWRAMLPLD